MTLQEISGVLVIDSSQQLCVCFPVPTLPLDTMPAEVAKIDVDETHLEQHHIFTTTECTAASLQNVAHGVDL